MLKATISQILRKLRLLRCADRINFLFEYFKTRKANKKFIKGNAGIKIPPPYMMYESFNLKYKNYYEGGASSAKWLIDHFKKHTDLENKKILDWGCGPARIVRHLSDLLKNCEIFGTDYNKKSIKWCQKNINNVFFTSNELSPPLSYEDNYFDIVYAISIFTHLSADMHYKWINEVFRILKKGGIFFFTSHGIIFKQKLSLNEQYDFDEGNVVIKANTKEGHRSYGAFHPPVFIRSLIKDFILLEHIEGQNIDTRLQQDIWIIKK